MIVIWMYLLLQQISLAGASGIAISLASRISGNAIWTFRTDDDSFAMFVCQAKFVFRFEGEPSAVRDVMFTTFKTSKLGL